MYLRRFLAPCPDVPIFCNWSSLRKLSRIFLHFLWISLPGNKIKNYRMILLFTSRYLATGNSFHSLHYEYLLGVTTIREIVRDTCEAIWKCLWDAFMPQKSEDWLHTADEFYERTNFPNCLGAVDGKHIRMCKPDDSGSLLFIYRTSFPWSLLH